MQYDTYTEYRITGKTIREWTSDAVESALRSVCEAIDSFEAIGRTDCEEYRFLLSAKKVKEERLASFIRHEVA